MVFVASLILYLAHLAAELLLKNVKTFTTQINQNVVSTGKIFN